MITGVVDRVGGRLVTLDDPVTRAAAAVDPVEFLQQQPSGLLAIDEVQRVPELLFALKLTVDRDPRPGRFLLTGSANVLALPTVQDSLAGRAENLDLFGFGQGELKETPETFLDRLMSGDSFLAHQTELTRSDYLERACAGASPEALSRPPGRRRAAWFPLLRDRLGSRFVAGMILHTGQVAATFGPPISAVPLDVLWAG